MGDVAKMADRSGALQRYLDQVVFNGHAYPLAGLTQTLQGNREEIDGSFTSLVWHGFRSNAIVYACEQVRLAAFSEARFQYRTIRNGRPDEMFGNASLSILEHPWTGGVTGDLLTRVLLYADFGGTGFVVRRRAEPDRLRVPRPDWMTFILGSDLEPDDPNVALDAEIVGYLYHPGGPHKGHAPEILFPEEVAHFAPIPDPLAKVRGIPWLAPVVREIAGDSAATSHKLRYFENGATPNLVVSLDKDIAAQAFKDWVALFQEKEPTREKVYKTLYLGGGATATVVGNDLKQIDFKTTQGAGETRIAAAAGVHPVIVGLSEGLNGSSLNAGNFSAARRRFVDLTVRPLWRNVSGSLESIVRPPANSQLWVDDRDISFLREDAKDRAEIQKEQFLTIESGVRAGFTPESTAKAVMADDLSLLVHTGLFSVQLQPPGTKTTPAPAEPAEPVPDEAGRSRTALAPYLPASHGKEKA